MPVLDTNHWHGTLKMFKQLGCLPADIDVASLSHPDGLVDSFTRHRANGTKHVATQLITEIYNEQKRDDTPTMIVNLEVVANVSRR